MTAWVNEPDLGLVRERVSLVRLTEAERLKWHQFWDAVEALRLKAAKGMK
jgi:hypothetical protein